jgi:putative aldouronate transport system substrate-binding protein
LLLREISTPEQDTPWVEGLRPAFWPVLWAARQREEVKVAEDHLGRRAFVRELARGTALLGGLIAACTPAPTPSTNLSARAPTAAVGSAPTSAAASRPNGVLPTYLPLQNGPKPDYPNAGQQYEDGWDNYPMPPIQAWTKEPPGLGSTVTAFSNAFNPPATPLDQNPAWQAVNKRLNATVNFNVVAPADYAAKLGTIMAGDELPDVMLFPGGLNVTLGGSGGTTGLPQFLQAKCADLTPFLAGDGVKDYPYLAAIPTYAWKNSGSSVNGHLYMLPIQRYVPGTALFKNTTYYDQEIGADYIPKDAADLKRVYLALNRPQDNRWATAAYQGTGLHILFYAALWGAPNNWAWDAKAGKLTKNFETPEFKAAVGYARDLWASGVYHPNSLNYADINAARLDFVGGRFGLYPEGFGQPWQDFWRRGLKNNPPYNFTPLPPFAAQLGGTPTHFFGPGFLATNAFKKASDDRVKELLRICDFLASPFGSQEDLLLQYGLKDQEYSLDDSGKLTLNDRSNADANYVNWKYLVQHPQVMYVPDIPGYAKAEYDAEHALIPAGIYDPTLGNYSPTLGTKGALLNRTMLDGITDIIAGRRPLEDYDGLVKDWAAAGGDQMRKELQDAMSQGGST